MNETSEPISDRVFHQLLSVLRYSRQHTRQMSAEHGIKPRQFSVLRFLLDSGPATVGQIQAYLHNSPSTASTLISQLEDMDYVTRNRSLKDNRVVFVELTETGRDKAITTPLGGLPLLRRRLSKLPEERLVQIEAVLAEIYRLMETPPVE